MAEIDAILAPEQATIAAYWPGPSRARRTACGDSGQVVALEPGLGIVRAVPCIRRDGRVVEGARLERV